MEQFIPITNFETFAISNFGEVKDLRTKKLKNKFNNAGYLTVCCQNQYGWKAFRVHRLVAEHFLEKDKTKTEVDHIDRNTTNNNINNLRWVDDYEQAENRLFKRDLPKYITFDDPKSKKNPYSCWSIQIRNIKIHFKKRFRTDKFTLEQVIEFRNNLLKLNNIPIID